MDSNFRFLVSRPSNRHGRDTRRESVGASAIPEKVEN